MTTVIVVFIICYFVYKIMNSGSCPDKKEVADVVEKSINLMIIDIKENFNKYEKFRNGKFISEEEEKAYIEFKEYMDTANNMIAHKFAKFKKEI